MNNINNKKIVQHNDLIMSVARMETIPLKYFELAVACLDTDNIPEDRTVYLSKELLFSFFNAKSKNKHSKFKKALLELHQQAAFFMEEVDKKSGEFEFKIISPLERTSWNNLRDHVTIQFSESIIPYLIELKANFTQYLLSDIGKLKSKYAIIIYKWLSMNYNQYEHYKFKGSRTEKQLETLKNPIISIEDLRKLTDTENSYSKMTNFTTRVLDEPITAITENTILNVEYRKIKKGSRIAEIQFFITKKHVAKNEFYKEEEQDSAYLEEKETKKQETKNLYAEALESNYTDVLGEYDLITFKDIRDKELMAGLQKSVYPLYDELKKLKGGQAVEKHISYVSSRKEDYTKRNIVRYLHECIKNYLPRANIENNPESMFE